MCRDTEAAASHATPVTIWGGREGLKTAACAFGGRVCESERALPCYICLPYKYMYRQLLPLATTPSAITKSDLISMSSCSYRTPNRIMNQTATPCCSYSFPS